MIIYYNIEVDSIGIYETACVTGTISLQLTLWLYFTHLATWALTIVFFCSTNSLLLDVQTKTQLWLMSAKLRKSGCTLQGWRNCAEVRIPALICRLSDKHAYNANDVHIERVNT